MTSFGYTLSSEEHAPAELVRNAARAEGVGFDFVSISDHYHPWVSEQGHSPFVWSVLGAVAQATERVDVGIGVTCPTVRLHPAITAHAAATTSLLLGGRFFLGVGTGEALNEHITGAHWPPISRRQEMLVESLAVIRELWQGSYTTHYGQHYTVENARIYTLPETLPPIYIAAGGVESADLAGRHGDGFINTTPEKEVVDAYLAAGGPQDRVYGQITVCWAEDLEDAKRTAHEFWRYTALPGQLTQELALPRYFEEASQLLTPDDVAEKIVCSPDPEPYLAKIQEYVEAGFTHVYLHQVGHDQAGFFEFAKRHLLPNA